MIFMWMTSILRTFIHGNANLPSVCLFFCLSVYLYVCLFLFVCISFCCFLNLCFVIICLFVFVFFVFVYFSFCLLVCFFTWLGYHLCQSQMITVYMNTRFTWKGNISMSTSTYISVRLLTLTLISPTLHYEAFRVNTLNINPYVCLKRRLRETTYIMPFKTSLLMIDGPCYHV